MPRQNITHTRRTVTHKIFFAVLVANRKEMLYTVKHQQPTQEQIMQAAIATYRFIRTQQQVNAIDACTDAAQLHGISVSALAAALIAQGIDTARLSLI